MATMAKDRPYPDTSSESDGGVSEKPERPEPSAPPAGSGAGAESSSFTSPQLKHLEPSAPSWDGEDIDGNQDPEEPIAFDENGSPLPPLLPPPKGAATIVAAPSPSSLPLAQAISTIEAAPTLPSPSIPLAQAVPAPHVAAGGEGDCPVFSSEFVEWKKLQKRLFSGLCLVILALVGTVIWLVVMRAVPGSTKDQGHRMKMRRRSPPGLNESSVGDLTRDDSNIEKESEANEVEGGNDTEILLPVVGVVVILAGFMMKGVIRKFQLWPEGGGRRIRRMWRRLKKVDRSE